MDRQTLSALRRLLMLTPFEAGRELMRDETRPNGVSEHAWKCWENGENPIPERVAHVMHTLMAVREKRIEQIMQAQPAVVLWWALTRRLMTLGRLKLSNNLMAKWCEKSGRV
ncbi:DUF1870 family protein [Neisseriaceae bacterium B1]